MLRKTIFIEGAKLSYTLVGSGPVVVLLHGFGEDGRVWDGQLSIFPNHTLLVPDLPGSGDSELITDMSMEGMAATVKSMTDVESGGLAGARKAVIIGHSMGGYIALAYAEKYPDSVAGFGLFHSTAYADSEVKKESRRKGIAFITEKGGPAFLATTIPTLYCEAFKTANPQIVAAQTERANNFSAAALVYYYKAMMQRPDRTAVLRNATVPVLFVLGRYDEAIPLKDGLEQCHLPRMSYIHILEQSGHMAMHEEPQKTAAILNQFVSQIEKTAATR